MKLRVKAKAATGFTSHCIATVSKNGGGPVSVERIPEIKELEIEQSSDGTFLFYIDAHGECVADTWHENVDDAKKQANLEFQVNENDWEPMKN